MRSQVINKISIVNMLGKHFLLSYCYCKYCVLSIYRLGLGLRLGNISHKWACYYTSLK